MGLRSSSRRRIQGASNMSQPTQGWHPNPQLMQQSGPQQMPPPGWSGSWPPTGGVPPGYPGPPPMPHGAPPLWNAGYWQYNPHMRNAQQPWAPGMAWGAPPNYNPYKRVPRPPSPSYWQTQLTDNGLGLEGMVKKCVRVVIDALFYSCAVYRCLMIH